MSWKKNGFSYILWAMYTLAVGIGLLSVSTVLCGYLGYETVYAFGLSGVYLLVAGVFVLCLYQLTKRIPNGETENTMLRLLIEGVVLIGLLAVGIILRIDALQQVTDWNEGIRYFEAALVAEGQSVPQIVHGTTYIYVSLLHLLLLLVGNKLSAVIWFQMVIQLLAIIVLFFAIRRLSGVLQAMITAAVLLLSPYMISGATELSPEWLFLLCYGITLWILAGRMDKTQTGLLHYLTGGILIGICIYLDIFGVTLLVFAAGVFSVMRDKPTKKLVNERGMVFLAYVAGAILGWLTAIIIDCISCRNGFAAVVKAWALLYAPKGFHIPVIMELLAEIGLADVVAVLGLMGLGIFSFWCRKRRERQGVWIGVTIVLVLLQSFGMMTDHIDGIRYLYVMFAIMAGIGVADCFAMHRVVYTSDSTSATDCAEVTDTVEVIEEVPEIFTQEAVAVEPAPAVKFLDNPLPLPKKHVAKVMDYRITDVETDADYDYDVAADDDYDI